MRGKVVVAVTRCADYRPDTVRRAVEEGLTLLGPLASLLGPARRLLLKPNLLHGDKPDRGSTTHPAVFGGVAAVLRDRGYDLSYGDSPAFQSPRGAVVSSGFADVAAQYGVRLADFDSGEERSHPGGRQHRVFFVARGALEAEAIVNLPKLKTHALTRMTGAVKNMFGVVPGLEKSWFHARLPEEESFSRMLADLAGLIRPRLSIMDAVYGMEGNGPRNGSLVHTGLILMSSDPVALDATACRIMGLDPAEVYLLSACVEYGLGVTDEREIEIRGIPLREAAGRPYALNPPNQPVFSKSPLLKYLKRFIVPRPVISDARCTRCLQCVKICPVQPKAVERGPGKRPPQYDYGRCIRCYCCQETCPEGAIKSRVPFLGVLFHGLGKRFS